MNDRSMAVRTALSGPRFDRYLKASDNNLDQAIELYSHNMRLSAALTNLTHLYEIVLRNKIDAILRGSVGADWMVSMYKDAKRAHDDRQTIATTVFERVIYTTDDFVSKAVFKAGQQAQKGGHRIDQNTLVSSATLGFWCDLLTKRYEPWIWDLLLAQGFPKIKRNDVHRRTEFVMKLRNRLAHYEPVIFSTSDDRRIIGWQEFTAQYVDPIRSFLHRLDRQAYPELEPLLDVSSAMDEVAGVLAIDRKAILVGSVHAFHPRFDYVFLNCEGFPDRVHCPRDRFSSDGWSLLRAGQPVQFTLEADSAHRAVVGLIMNILPRRRPGSPDQALNADAINGSDVVHAAV